MDAGQIAELRAWASRLEARADDEELRAAGKAILLLVGEVERLQPLAGAAEPSRADTVALSVEASSQGEEDEDQAAEESPEEPASLRNRLRRTFGYGGES
jgi:hypothetical protein